MLTQLYLELGLSLWDALRAAEADLKHNSAPGYSASGGPFLKTPLSREAPLFPWQYRSVDFQALECRQLATNR
jgi:hypothetical protein